MIRPSVYQFAFGDAVITNILDGYIQRNDMHPFVATNATADEVKAVASQYRLPFPDMEHNFVATLIDTGEKLIAFDPGFGNKAPASTAGWYMRGLELAGYKAEDVDLVVISHCHSDHIGNLMNDSGKVFTNAQVIFGRTEFDYWKAGEAISEQRKPTKALFDKVALPLEAEARFIEPGDEVVPGLTAIDAFGHLAGHMVYRFENDGHTLLLLADTTPHYAASFARPDWHFLMDDDPEKASESRRRILTMAADNELPIIGFHIPFPSIGYVDKEGEAFRFRPASYQFNLTQLR